MRERSLGTTTLAFASVMVALYCQYAAIALLLTGSVYTAAGSVPAFFTLVLGAVFLGLTFAAYFLGYGFWTRKHWSWAGGNVLFVGFLVANLALSVISANLASLIVPSLAAIAALWFLHRPAIRAALLNEREASAAPAPVSEPIKRAEPVH